MSLGLATRGYMGGGGGGANTVRYRMRAYDTFLNKIVFWTSEEAPDGAGTLYTGPGPLANIVIQVIIRSR